LPALNVSALEKFTTLSSAKPSFGPAYSQGAAVDEVVATAQVGDVIAFPSAS